jgi:acetyl esterase/lipase
MIYYHGGGYIAGNLDTEDAHCRIFAAKVPCLVISVNYPKVPRVKLDDIIQLGTLAVPWVRSHCPLHYLYADLVQQCRSRATDLGDDPSKTILCGGSAGAFLSAQVAYRLMAEGDHSSVTGCVLLFAVALNWEYNGKYKHLYTAWEENGNSGTPVFGLELAKFIWCKWCCRICTGYA